MREPFTIAIGSAVFAADTGCGEISRIIVDPRAGTVTNVVVDPKHGSERARLVPLALIERTDGEIHLSATPAEFSRLEHADQMKIVPISTRPLPFSPAESFAAPYAAFGKVGKYPAGSSEVAEVVSVEQVPFGEVEVHEGDPVHATDGEIGRARGVIVDSDSGRVTHLLVEEGHLVTRKEVAVPFAIVTDLGEHETEVAVAKSEIKSLEPFDIDHVAAP
jgi:uncharacterized protein YrrD